VAAGSVVIRDVPPYAMVAGVPARIIGYMCERGERLRFDGDGRAVTSYGQRYRRSADGVVSKEQP
jgi:UDP-2-acetamido-3-amino-2,3-dideoxy-glucuronate N-acetyltransferase